MAIYIRLLLSFLLGLLVFLSISCEKKGSCNDGLKLIYELTIEHQDYFSNPPDFIDYNLIPNDKLLHWTSLVLKNKPIEMDSLNTTVNQFEVCPQIAKFFERNSTVVSKPYKYGISMSKPIWFSQNEGGIFLNVFDEVLPQQDLNKSSYVPIFLLFEKRTDNWLITEYQFDNYAIEEEEKFETYMVTIDSTTIEAKTLN